jgi:hypothetical protein
MYNVQRYIVALSRNHFFFHGKALIRSIFIVIGENVAAIDIKVFRVATEIQRRVAETRT